MRHARVFACSALLAGALGCVDSSQPLQPLQPLNPDLYLTLSCDKRYLSDIEESALAFYRTMGLAPLNRGRLMREHYRSDRYGAQVIGLDDKGTVIIEFRERPFKEIEYAAVLYSLPPTVRKTDIESRIERFANQLTTEYSCQVSKVERHENGLEARDTFINILKLKRGWYKQASDIKPAK